MSIRADPQAHTTAGAVRGIARAHDDVFLGIPYAEAPVGALRFEAPQPRSSWSGVLNAVAYGATPLRSVNGITTIPEPSIPGDDVLGVNVFTPSTDRATSGGLPVIVYIHGGGYIAGSAASPWYDGRSFTRDGVVLVSVAYRLGFEGFGWLPDAPANRGVLDWLLALSWVQENISAFGGDPSRVTVMGQSAGGGAVMTLLGIPSTSELFARAISMSGAPADIPLAKAIDLTRAISMSLGRPPSRSTFAALSDTQLDAIDRSAFASAATARDELRLWGTRAGTLPFGPIIDGELVRTDSLTAMLESAGSNKQLMIGATRNEFSREFSAWREDLAALERNEIFELLVGSDDGRDEYLAIAAESGSALAGRIVTDRLFRTRVVEWSEARRAGSSWVYDFAWPSAVSGLAEHCSDLPFVFDLLDADGTARVLGAAAPAALAAQMHSTWVAFARGQSPDWLAGHSNARVFGEDVPSTMPPYGSAEVLSAPARRGF